MAAPAHDVVVVGDGPAGAAVASECAGLGLDVVAVGPGRPWTPTYGTWIDDVPDLPSEVFAATREHVIVGAARLRRLARPYGVFDNAALREHLALDAHLRVGTMRAIESGPDAADVVLDGGVRLRGRVVIDATGAEEEPIAWQTAYGVVVDESTAGEVATTDAVTLMDWSWTGGCERAPTFLYAVPVGGGWLVEHTALAAVPAIEPAALRRTLVDRLGERAVADAESQGRTEQVSIPMGLPPRAGSGRVVRFGAAAGMIHPATGFSVAAALRAAPRVAHAIAAGSDLRTAVWPRAARRARALHDYGLATLLRLDPADTVDFFDAFFRLPTRSWSAYLRVDAAPGAVARAMAGTFRRAPWSVRRRLARLDRRSGRDLLAGLTGRIDG